MVAIKPEHKHPAILAWRQLGISNDLPSGITTLQEKEKAAAYLLHDPGPGNHSVVAKRSPLAKALVERTIYEQVLPRLPVRSLDYLGFVQLRDDTAWLFIEHAAGEEYSALRPDHCQLASRWLACLHLTAAEMDLSDTLPGKAPAMYFEQLGVATERMERGCSNSALSRDDRAALVDWIRQLDHLRTNWDRVRDLCAAVPSTVVHGDFARKNMVVDASSGELLVFDWGTSGWGASIVDLPQNDEQDTYWAAPDLETYCDVVRERWPQVDVKSLQAFAATGKIVRILTALHGDAKALDTPWAARVMHKLPSYFDHLASGMAAAGISSNAGSHSKPRGNRQ